MAISKPYDYTSKLHMAALAAQVASMPKERWASFHSCVLELDLMRAPWWLNLAARLVKWLHHTPTSLAWHAILFRVPALVEAMHDELVQHISSGKDHYDKKSAGGLCEGEVETLIELMQLHGWNPDGT